MDWVEEASGVSACSPDGNPELLVDLNRVVLHDAVLNTAMAWKHIWESFEKSE